MENLGIERSYQAMADADLTLVVVDLSDPWNVEDRDLIERAIRQGSRIVVATNGDLILPGGRFYRTKLCRMAQSAGGLASHPYWQGIALPHLVSALTGEGIAELRTRARRRHRAARPPGTGRRLHHQPSARTAY